VSTREPDEDEDGYQRPLQDDDAHRLRKPEPLARHQAEGDDGVEAQAGRDRVGPVRDEAHEDAHDPCDQARGGGGRLDRKACAFEALDADEAEDRRVHEDDVGHDDERRRSRDRVPRERRPVLVEAEVAVEDRALEARAQLCHEDPSLVETAPAVSTK
jgi:hypothetical protein